MELTNVRGVIWIVAQCSVLKAGICGGQLDDLHNPHTHSMCKKAQQRLHLLRKFPDFQ